MKYTIPRRHLKIEIGSMNDQWEDYWVWMSQAFGVQTGDNSLWRSLDNDFSFLPMVNVNSCYYLFAEKTFNKVLVYTKESNAGAEHAGRRDPYWSFASRDFGEIPKRYQGRVSSSGNIRHNWHWASYPLRSYPQSFWGTPLTTGQTKCLPVKGHS